MAAGGEEASSNNPAEWSDTNDHAGSEADQGPKIVKAKRSLADLGPAPKRAP